MTQKTNKKICNKRQNGGRAERKHQSSQFRHTVQKKKQKKKTPRHGECNLSRLGSNTVSWQRRGILLHPVMTWGQHGLYGSTAPPSCEVRGLTASLQIFLCCGHFVEQQRSKQTGGVLGFWCTASYIQPPLGGVLEPVLENQHEKRALVLSSWPVNDVPQSDVKTWESVSLRHLETLTISPMFQTVSRSGLESRSFTVWTGALVLDVPGRNLTSHYRHNSRICRFVFVSSF